ncbi:MAG: helix-turn-helix domain-containing protein [Rhodothermaceae bacterium]|nr:helix-turn-helix domain-containing protein [Rhodothermaceae bacterium]
MDKNRVGPNDNIFEALGFKKEEAANLKIRAKLMAELTRYIRDEGLSLRKAGEVFDIAHPRVNDLLQGNIDKFTIDYLVNMMTKIGKEVSVNIKQRKAA